RRRAPVQRSAGVGEQQPRDGDAARADRQGGAQQARQLGDGGLGGQDRAAAQRGGVAQGGGGPGGGAQGALPVAGERLAPPQGDDVLRAGGEQPAVFRLAARGELAVQGRAEHAGQGLVGDPVPPDAQA